MFWVNFAEISNFKNLNNILPWTKEVSLSSDVSSFYNPQIRPINNTNPCKNAGKIWAFLPKISTVSFKTGKKSEYLKTCEPFYNPSSMNIF